MKQEFKRILSSFQRTLPYLPRVFELIWASSRAWTLVWLFLLIFQGLLPVATVYAIKYFVNYLAVTFRSQGGWDGVLFFAVLLGGILLLSEFFRYIILWIQNWPFAGFSTLKGQPFFKLSREIKPSERGAEFPFDPCAKAIETKLLNLL